MGRLNEDIKVKAWVLYSLLLGAVGDIVVSIVSVIERVSA